MMTYLLIGLVLYVLLGVTGSWKEVLAWAFFWPVAVFAICGAFCAAFVWRVKYVR